MKFISNIFVIVPCMVASMSLGYLATYTHNLNVAVLAGMCMACALGFTVKLVQEAAQ